MTESITTHYRACHLCEAICGLEISIQGKQILSIKGDKQDPFSRGHICPKAVAIQDIHNDSDRLRQPVKKVNGEWQTISWDEAFDEVVSRFFSIQQRFGNDSVAVYAGNPSVHNYGNMTHGRVIRKALGTKNNFSATSLDQLPHHFSGLALFGHQFLLPVPDIDRTDFMLILGANPLASNGSLMTVPDVKNRLQAIQQRGGQFIVIDPRRTETASIADHHYFIRPGSDAYLLLAMIKTLFDREWINTGHLGELVSGLDHIKEWVQPFDLARAEKQTGITAEIIEQLTKTFAKTEKAVVYGRMGVSVQDFGTVCQWAINILNILTGHLDFEGGAMFPSSAVAYVKPGEPGAGSFARFRSRVSGLPEFGGELPTVALTEEILEPGEGQIKSLLTIAGNPVLSSPNGRALDEALEQLEFMVAIDFYINETTRHADIILPPTEALEHDHYDLAFFRLAVRDTTRYNEPVFEAPESARHDWQIFNALAERLSQLKGIELNPLPAPHKLIDMGLQSGHYSESAGHPEKLSLKVLKDNPHGIDLGALKPSLTERLCTLDGKIHLDVAPIYEDIQRLDQRKNSSLSENELLLIGRRHVRSNNSWMHNSQRLVKGKPRWQLLMHPEDMKKREINDGALVRIKSRVGEVDTEVSASDEVMPGVVSLPHGWGHQRKGVRLSIAADQGGVSMNDLTDQNQFDELTGNASLNGVPVKVSAL